MSKKMDSLRYVHFGLSFGITMAVSIYFGFKGGMWLDNYFNTQPLFMLIGILLGVGVTFKSLLDNLKRLDKKPR
ncbi:MAG: AtpZ/AtpI family protein [Bacillota bacterium]